MATLQGLGGSVGGSKGKIVSDKGTELTAANKRDELRRRVDASRAELDRPADAEADKSASPPDGVRQLAMDYPFALLLGGVALGVVAGALIPRLGGRKLAHSAAAAAAAVGEIGLTYGRSALDAASRKSEEPAERIKDLGAAVRESAADLTRGAAQLLAQFTELAASARDRAGDVAGDVADEASGTAREIGRKIGRQAIKLTSHVRH